MAIKKKPLTIIQEAIEEEDMKSQPQKINNYVLIIIACGIVNIASLLFLMPSKSKVVANDEVPEQLSQVVVDINSKLQQLEQRINGLQEEQISEANIQKIYEKKLSVSIELIITRLVEIDKEISTAETNIVDVWKKIVSIEKKQIQIKNQVNDNK